MDDGLSKNSFSIWFEIHIEPTKPAPLAAIKLTEANRAYIMSRENI